MTRSGWGCALYSGSQKMPWRAGRCDKLIKKTPKRYLDSRNSAPLRLQNRGVKLGDYDLFCYATVALKRCDKMLGCPSKRFLMASALSRVCCCPWTT